MANDFNASLVINTAAAQAGVRDLDSAYRNLDKTLAAVSSSLVKGQGDLDRVAASMKALKDSNAALIQSEQAKAKAVVANAKAESVLITNNDKLATTANKNRVADAKVAQLTQRTVAAGLTASAASTRRDAETMARIGVIQAVGQARVTTETNRGATAWANFQAATTRAGGAADVAAARTERLAASTQRASQSALGLTDNLSNSRYLLYDVGQTYTVISAALLAIPVATAAVAMAYQKDFAQVIRTNDSLKETPGALEELRQELKDLGTQIPLTFAEFAQIATIGGQLGIAGNAMATFTDTVAKFGAASNVSLEQAATSFGRLQNSFDPMRKQEDFFNKIGSAIAYVGVKSAATETEIIAVSNQISAAGAQFGFAAQDIVGLSGALASVRIRPELARGAFQRIMLGLGRSADDGAEAFNKFGKYTGLAADESLKLFRSDPSAFFYKYIGGIKSAIKETGSVSGVLDDIGAKNVFDKQFILGLANGYKVFGDSMANAKSSFADGSFLNESTKGVFETLDAKLKRINTAVKNFQDTVAKGSVGIGSGLANTADALLAVVSATDRFARAVPGFSMFLNLVMGLGSAVGILLAFKAAQAFLLAGLVGFQQVLGKGTLAAGLTAKGILQQIAVTMLMAKGATEAQSSALVRQVGAYKAVGIAAATTAAMVKAGTLAGIGGVSNAAPVATSKLGGLARGFVGAGKSALGLVGGPLGALIIALGLVGLAFVQAEEKANAAGDAIARAGKNGDPAKFREIGDALTERTVDSWITDTVSGGIGNHGKNVRQLAEDVGISFDSIVKSVAKGKDANTEFLKVLDQYAQTKGFSDYADLSSKSATNLDNRKGELIFLQGVVDDLGKKSAESSKDIDAVDKAAGDAGDTANGAAPEVDGLAEAIEGAGDESETAAEKLDKFIGQVFGLADVSGDTQAALEKLGASIHESKSFSPGNAGGRENIDNFKEAIKSAATEQQYLIDSTGKSTQQASADYIAFVEGLVAQMASKGVDPARINQLADQAKGYFGSTLQAGAPVTMPLAIDGSQLQVQAATASEAVAAVLTTYNPKFKIGVDPGPANEEINKLAWNLAAITGWPYQVVVDALTDPASEKGKEVQALLKSITEGTYKPAVGADTSAAVSNIKNFADYAKRQLASIQNAYNNVARSAPTLAKYTKSLFPGVKGVTNSAPEAIRAPSTASVTTIAAPTQVAAGPSAAQFGALNTGYGNAAKAAQKAGEKGKKAGKDMADGIKDATEAANDYANRLKTGLQSAFDKQYGVTTATDAYHSALNAINKKRDEELKQIDELIAKQKELNNERNEELVNARKAGIEKDISLKYGEGARAQDYAAQEQTALDAAAAKQKDIQANTATIGSLQSGVGALTGYSDAAIANRAALRDLESKMNDMVVAYAATGASVDQVRAYAANLTGQFKLDVAQMGYNELAVGNLQGSLSRYIDVINSVPLVKPTEVTADTAQAEQGINAVGDALDALPDNHTITVGWKMTSTVRELPGQIYQGQQVWGVFNGSTGAATGQKFFNKGGHVGYAGGGHVGGTPPSNPRVDNIMTNIDGKRPAGLRSGEYVTQEPAVKFWGLDFMHAINNMKMPRFNGGGGVGVSGGGAGSGGMGVVALDAETLAAMATIFQQEIKLYADGKELAAAVNAGQRKLVAEGSNR